MLQHTAAKHARSCSLDKNEAPVVETDEKENVGPISSGKGPRIAAGTKRDFFGRIINEVRPVASIGRKEASRSASNTAGSNEERIWVSYNEGYSNAVRKPITLKELIDSFELP